MLNCTDIPRHYAKSEEVTIQREQLHRPVATVLDDPAEAVGVDHVDVQGVLDGAGQLREGELLQQPEHPDERACPVPGIAPRASI